MITTTEEDISVAQQWDEYRGNPIGFITEILDVKEDYVWSKMGEIAESVRDNQLTAVPAGHSVSKTYTAARLAVWFKACFNPSTVITTAPSDNQVRNQLWREIRMAIQSAGVDIGGKLTSLQWDCKPSRISLEAIEPENRGDWEKNFAIGFSTTADTASEHATKMQGWHNKWILIILDEAAGLLPPIWKAVLEGLIVNPRCKVLAIGNPTDPYSIFSDVCKKDSDWNVINVSVRDTPNYIEDKEIVPNLAGRAFENSIIKKYGENSNEHKYRCLGQFPDFAEGVIWGPEFGALDKKGHYGDFSWESTAPVYTIGDYGNIYTAIGFFQFIHHTIRMIDYYYDDIGIGVPGLCKMFDNMPYNYAKSHAHWCGPDYHQKHGSNRKSIGTGTTVLSEFKRLGYIMHCCDPHDFDEGIKITRDVIPLMRIDYTCSDYVDALRQYKFKKNLIYSTDIKPAYSKNPQDTPSRHPADMTRYLAWIYRTQLIVNDVRIGSPVAIPAARQSESSVWGGEKHLLDFGREVSSPWT